MAASNHDQGLCLEHDARISVVVPTLNSAGTLDDCLSAVRAQDFPQDAIEVVVADGGSTDDTLAIAERHGALVVPNTLRTGESGKSAGIAKATGEYIALVDSDNILDNERWLSRMLMPFTDPDIVASEPIEYVRREGDPGLTRYFAMLGMNDPLCLFLGNYDRQCLVTGSWTGLDVVSEDRGDYLKLTLEEPGLPTIGANGFVIRRSLLDAVTWQPYFFDIDVMHQAVAAGHPHVAKVKCGIVHLYCSSLRDFGRKQDRRVRDFLFFSADRQRSYPWRRMRLGRIAWFCAATVLGVPLLLQMLRGWMRRRDPAWLYHLPVCWITLSVYGLAFLRKLVGITPRPRERERWQA